IDLAKRKSLQQIHGLLYCLLRARNERVTSVLGASPKNRQNHRRSRSCWAAASCRGNVFPWEPAGQVYPGFRYCACWNEVLGLLANKKRICPEHRMSLSQSLARRSPASLETVQGILRDLVARHCQDDVLTSVRQIPAREAKFRPIPRWVASALSEAYRAKAIQELYSHQAATSELVHDGKNVVVVTPTASGKTLCYNLPVLNAVLENADTRALYLFPTKALAQDQLAELQDLSKRLDDGFGVFTYDGDTPSDARKAIRECGHIVLTNPDMLHTGILPHHTKWMRLFENLRYIVLDELHTYRGVFGSHLANVLRRLKRVAKFYGSDPQFICCSATIANPGELASQLIEKEVEVVEENGAPAGEKL